MIVHRAGFPVTHHAEVPENRVVRKAILGREEDVVRGEVTAACGAVLKGTILRMPAGTPLSCARCARGVR